LNAAYASFLRWWPDLTLGDWFPTRELRDEGIYSVASRFGQTILTGSELVELSGHDLGGVDILDGWAWLGNRDPEQSPFRAFVGFCLSYQGPHRQFVRRLVPLLVGKTRAGRWIGRTWYASASACPILYASVVSALWQRMYRTARPLGADLRYAFVDSLHTTAPLPEAELGREPGQWKLEETGPIEYLRPFGWWRSSTTYRHQGTQEEGIH